MNLDNLYISAYIENLCFRFSSTEQDSPEQTLLNDLKSILPPEKFKEVSDFSRCIRDFRNTYNDDIHPEDARKQIEDYEKAIDLSGLSDRYKFRLYDDLLSYFEKENQFSSYYIFILNKKIKTIPSQNDNALVIAAKQAIRARHSVPDNLYLSTLQKIYNRLEVKTKLPRAEMLGIVIKLDKQNKPYVVPINKMEKDDIRKRCHIIQTILKTPLSSEDKISLAEEAIALATKTPFSRAENFRIKRDMHQLLEREYRLMDAPEQALKHYQETLRWQNNIDLSMEKGYTRSGKIYNYK